MVTTEIMRVTPALARAWLEHNEGNRTVNRTHIVDLARDMIDGRFRLTHQPIAFDATGNLIDGQHRLMAIVQSGCTVELMVARYTDITTAKALPVDIGKKRTAAQVLQESPRAVQIVSTAFRVVVNSTGGQIPRHMLGATIERHNGIITEIIDRCKVNTSKTPAAVRAAMFFRLIKHAQSAVEMQWILAQITAYATTEYSDMCPLMLALNKQRENGSWNGAGHTDSRLQQHERACRTYIALDYSRRHDDVKTIRVSGAYAELRSAVEEIGFAKCFVGYDAAKQ